MMVLPEQLKTTHKNSVSFRPGGGKNHHYFGARWLFLLFFKENYDVIMTVMKIIKSFYALENVQVLPFLFAISY